ncbi:MAG: hypothetical protein WCO84_00410 [bacterium]
MMGKSTTPVVEAPIVTEEVATTTDNGAVIPEAVIEATTTQVR